MIVVKNTASEKRGRGRPRAFDRTEALGRAALTFWEHGYEGASIADLTAAMGITPQSLYAAFGSKAALYGEALAWYQSQIASTSRRILDEEADVITALTRFIQYSARAFAESEQPKGCMISTALLGCAEENEAVAQQVASMRTATIAWIQARVERGIAAGQMKSNTDAAAIARFVGAVIQGLSVQAHDGATAKELEAVAAVAAAVLRNQRENAPPD